MFLLYFPVFSRIPLFLYFPLIPLFSLCSAVFPCSFPRNPLFSLWFSCTFLYFQAFPFFLCFHAILCFPYVFPVIPCIPFPLVFSSVSPSFPVFLRIPFFPLCSPICSCISTYSLGFHLCCVFATIFLMSLKPATEFFTTNRLCYLIHLFPAISVQFPVLLPITLFIQL